MKLGVSLPNQVPVGLNGRLMLDWARTADAAGFHGVTTIDKPNYDGWDPLTTLAAAAAVTERVRLATTILQLPNRNAVDVAKHAAAIDVLSGGRLELGVAAGGREDDFQVYGASFRDRGRRFPEQVERIRRFWEEARASTDERGALGPAPVQDPPRIWMGGMNEKTIRRAVETGDGFVFGTAGVQRMTEMTPVIREMARAAGKSDYPVVGLAYVAVGDEATEALDRGAASVLRYYGMFWAPPEQMIHHGPAEKVAEELQVYEASGIDVLYVWPQINEIAQLEVIAEKILPHFA